MGVYFIYLTKKAGPFDPAFKKYFVFYQGSVELKPSCFPNNEGA
jgi:hypothetical protein